LAKARLPLDIPPVTEDNVPLELGTIFLILRAQMACFERAFRAYSRALYLAPPSMSPAGSANIWLSMAATAHHALAAAHWLPSVDAAAVVFKWQRRGLVCAQVCAYLICHDFAFSFDGDAHSFVRRILCFRSRLCGWRLVMQKHGI
jgi:hypothetical protein